MVQKGEGEKLWNTEEVCEIFGFETWNKVIGLCVMWEEAQVTWVFIYHAIFMCCQ